jgi:CRISPR-associated Csx2 family protein
MTTLITTMGTGHWNQEKKENEYSRVCYQFKEEVPVKTSYIGNAILNCSLGSNINKVIVLGTASAGWANILSGFELENKTEYENFYIDLKTVEENAKQDKSIGISQNQLLKLQEILINSIKSTNFELHLIPLAYETQELWEFLSKLVDIIFTLPDNERIIIDVTHGFRYHQVFMSSTLGFINQLSLDSNRRIRLVYGILEREQGKNSPIIELSMVVAMHDWSAALNSFLFHGDSEPLATLVRSYRINASKNLAESLETLSFEIAGNYIFILKTGQIASLPQTLKITLRHIETFLEKSHLLDASENNLNAVKYVLKELTKWINKFIKLSDPVDLLFALARDHLKRRRYLLALTCCYEGLRIFRSLVTKISHYEKGAEDRIKDEFKKKLLSVSPTLKNKYYTICVNKKESLRSLRNQTVHGLPSDNKEHVMAKGLRDQVTKRVAGTIDIIQKLQKAGIDYQKGNYSFNR